MDATLSDLLKKAAAKVAAMTPEQRAEMFALQRKSWVRGEMMMDHPNMSEEEFEAIWKGNGFTP